MDYWISKVLQGLQHSEDQGFEHKIPDYIFHSWYHHSQYQFRSQFHPETLAETIESDPLCIIDFFYMFLSFILWNFSVWTQKCFYKHKNKNFSPQKVEKISTKSCILMAVGCFLSLLPRLPKTAIDNLFYRLPTKGMWNILLLELEIKYYSPNFSDPVWQ